VQFLHFIGIEEKDSIYTLERRLSCSGVRENAENNDIKEQEVDVLKFKSKYLVFYAVIFLIYY
jgi:hypothetical protein